MSFPFIQSKLILESAGLGLAAAALIGSTSLAVQLAINAFHNHRLKVAKLKYLGLEPPKEPSWTLKKYADKPHDGLKEFNFDPVQELFLMIRNTIKSNIDLPPWTSPLMNAIDLDYRKALNVKISVVRAQVAKLEKQLQEKQIN